MALIEIAATTTMEEVLRAYPSAKVGLFPRARSLSGGFAAWVAVGGHAALPAPAEG